MAFVAALIGVAAGLGNYAFRKSINFFHFCKIAIDGTGKWILFGKKPFSFCLQCILFFIKQSRFQIPFGH